MCKKEQMNSVLFFMLMTRGKDRILDMLDSIKHASKVKYTCLFLHFKFSEFEKMSYYLRGPAFAAHILFLLDGAVLEDPLEVHLVYMFFLRNCQCYSDPSHITYTLASKAISHLHHSYLTVFGGSYPFLPWWWWCLLSIVSPSLFVPRLWAVSFISHLLVLLVGSGATVLPSWNIQSRGRKRQVNSKWQYGLLVPLGVRTGCRRGHRWVPAQVQEFKKDLAEDLKPDLRPEEWVGVCRANVRWDGEEMAFQADRNWAKARKWENIRSLREMKKVIWVGKETGNWSYRSEMARSGKPCCGAWSYILLWISLLALCGRLILFMDPLLSLFCFLAPCHVTLQYLSLNRQHLCSTLESGFGHMTCLGY